MYPLQGTAARREHLWVGKYFRCQCPRCLDPTELGTHFSSLLCPACPTSSTTAAAGLLTFDSSANSWPCQTCAHIATETSVQLRLAEARELAAQLDDRWTAGGGDALDACEKLIEQQMRVLNANHYLVVESKQKLAAMLRSVCDHEDVWNGRNREQLLRMLAVKLRLCEELLPLLRRLKPGISRLTGERCLRKIC